MNNTLIITLLLATAALTPATAQTVQAISARPATPQATSAKAVTPRAANGRIPVEAIRLERQGDAMNVAFRLRLDSLRIRGEQQLVLTPFLAGHRDTVALKPVYLNGRAQEIRDRRHDVTYPADAVVIRRHNGEAQQVEYTAQVPYQRWMHRATLLFSEDLCGCGRPGNMDTVTVHRPADLPLLPYVQPTAEAQKVRHEEGSAYIAFKLDKYDILPNFRSNRAELDKIIKTIDLVRADSNVTFTGVGIHGYASPDGNYNHNAKLAANRSKAVTDYVSKLYSFKPGICTTASTPEDWDGFIRRMKDGALGSKSAWALRIAEDSTLTPDEKEAKLRYDGPAYKVILADIFPPLRHTDYTVTYTVRPFTVEESLRIMRSNPKQLSLQEFYRIAQTMTPGSKEFNEVFATAQKFFPDDEAANTNAAVTRLNAITPRINAEGYEPTAEELATIDAYLSKAGNGSVAQQAREVRAEMTP